MNALNSEAERKDVVFRMDFDATQCRDFPPFTFFAWDAHQAEIDQIVSDVEDKTITLQDGHSKIKGIMEGYYGCPYPLDQPYLKCLEQVF